MFTVLKKTPNVQRLKKNLEINNRQNVTLGIKDAQYDALKDSLVQNLALD